MYNKKKEALIPQTSFPSTYVSDAEKMKKKFGAQIGKAIQYEWFQAENGSQSGRFFSRWSMFNERRNYAKGQQSTQKYKDGLSFDGDLSYLNLEWTPVPVIPKMVDIMVNGMADRLFEVRSKGIDAASMEKKELFRINKEKDMAAKPLLDQIQMQFGVDAFSGNPEDVPANDEELKLQMEIEYEDGIELANEAAINTVLLDNNRDQLERRLYYDVVVDGMCAVREDFYVGDTIRVKRLDPGKVVHSYTSDPCFKDGVFYWGDVEQVHINDLIKIDPDLTRADLEEIAEYSDSWQDRFRGEEFHNSTMFRNETVTLLNFDYKTTRKIVFKKKGDKYIEKDDEWNPTPEDMEERGYEKVEREFDVWYEGTMVLGSDIILKWQLIEDMIRTETPTQRAFSRYHANAPRMERGYIESHTSRMMPFGDLIQMTHLKLQQVVQKIAPDGVYIDADGLVNIDLGNGNVYNPNEALKLYLQTGSVVGRSSDEEGEYNHAKIPIQELNKSSGMGKIQSLIVMYNHYMQMMRDSTGLNEARDGSDLDPNSLVGIQKLAALNSNTATRHILYSVVEVFKELGENISKRVAYVIKEYPEHREEFIRRIGRFNVELLSNMRGLHMHDFAIYIEMTPDDEERAHLEANIQIGLSKELIDVDDAIDIRSIKNVKLANQYLKIKKRKKHEQAMKDDAMKQQMQAQINQQAQMIAAQIKERQIQMETQGKVQVKQAEAGFDIEKMREEANLKLMLMDKEYQYQIGIAQKQAEGLSRRDSFKEEAKDKRIDRQSTQTSKIAEQKQKGLGSINFESNEDSLDGFDLSEFEPR